MTYLLLLKRQGKKCVIMVMFLKVKPDFVFRLGKVLFHGNSLIDLENVNKSSDIESALEELDYYNVKGRRFELDQTWL
ncbi:hypothetical protein FRX31_011003, partial [Thalictrum thalictroides]